ncbi:MAG: hypothetical protein ACUZ8H_16330, partial [Candidatus Anammoxibacter sp.]
INEGYRLLGHLLPLLIKYNCHCFVFTDIWHYTCCVILQINGKSMADLIKRRESFKGDVARYYLKTRLDSLTLRHGMAFKKDLIAILHWSPSIWANKRNSRTLVTMAEKSIVDERFQHYVYMMESDIEKEINAIQIKEIPT